MNIDLRGKTIQVLTLDDKIKKNDLIRPLFESGDEGGFNLSYKPDEWNGLLWQLVKEDFSGWIGKTQRDYNHFNLSKKDRDRSDKEDLYLYEIVRIVS